MATTSSARSFVGATRDSSSGSMATGKPSLSSSSSWSSSRPLCFAAPVSSTSSTIRSRGCSSAAASDPSVFDGHAASASQRSPGPRGAAGERYGRVARTAPGAVCRAACDREGAAVVNNCAAAVLLMLTALAKGKEVIVARGELVEIGGGFRMPDVMRLSGARMVEVGTTNRTRAEDYAAAITPRTAAIMKVHASNFQVIGFTESVELKELAAIARQHQLLILHDLGSGALLQTAAYGLAEEPRIQDSLRSGADLVACSADKLLGGPQAGLLLGRAALVDRVMKHPLARAVRVDKMTLAALIATLDLYLTQPPAGLPIWGMLGASAESIAARARAWQSRLMERGTAVEVVAAESTVGGGSLPGERLATTAIAIPPRRGGAADLLRRLREHEPPVIGRIVDERVLLDPRTVLPDEDDVIVEAVVAALL